MRRLLPPLRDDRLPMISELIGEKLLAGFDNGVGPGFI